MSEPTLKAPSVIKRKMRESIDDEFDEEDEEAVTSSGPPKPHAGKRSRKEGRPGLPNPIISTSRCILQKWI